LKLLLDDASYQKKGLEQIFSDLLKTSEEQLSTDDFTNIRRRLDEIQKLEDTNFRRSEMQSLKGMGKHR
jgi:tetrahydromethanopterin S-methyltransferase subunit G